MKSKRWMRISSAKAVAALGVAVSVAMGFGVSTPAVADGSSQMPTHFSGLLSDYTPSSIDGTPIKGAPYEMHGNWTLDLNPAWTTATFGAAIAMETSEVVNTDPNFDPGKLNPHTHHMSMTDGIVHNGPTDWQTMCSTVSSVTGGFAVTGTVYVTGNGANAPFGNPTPVTVCILGGSNTMASNTAYVEFANFTMTIGAPASGHFGPQPIHGVVANCGWSRNVQQACKATAVP